MKIPFVTPLVCVRAGKMGLGRGQPHFYKQLPVVRTINHQPSTIWPFIPSGGTLIKLSKIHTDSGPGIATTTDSPY